MKLSTALRLSPNPAAPHVVTFVGAGGKTSALFRLAEELTAQGQRVVTTTTTRLFRAQAEQSPAHLLVTDGTVDGSLDRSLDRTALDRLLGKHGQVMLVTDLTETKAAGLAPEVVDELAADRALGLDAILVEADGSRRRPVKAPADHEPVVPQSTTLLVPILGLDAIGLPIAEPHVHRPARMLALLGCGEGDRLTPKLAADLLLSPQGGAKGIPADARWTPLLNKADRPQGRLLGRLIARRLSAAGVPSLIGQVGSGEHSAIVERHGPTVAVVLAAGKSQRMGQSKQLLTIDGEPLVVRTVRTALESDANRVMVVTGAYEASVSALLAEKFAGAISAGRVQLVSNPDFARGQSTSVLAALHALPSTWQAVLFLPVDQPDLPAVLLRRLIRQWQRGADLVAPVVDGELRGAPALFDRRLEAALHRVTGDRGAGPILKKERAEVTTIATPAHWLRDLDTPEAWQAYVSFG